MSLFHYERKHLELTKEGAYLYEHALSLLANADKLCKEIQHVSDEKEQINMGATMTIGEFLVPKFLLSLYAANPALDLHLTLENTELLLDEVRSGRVDFALIEGLFNKEEFHSQLLKKEEMVLILPSSHELRDQKIIRIEDVLKSRVFVREQGSGTRDVFVQALAQYNLSLHNFAHCVEISNIHMIKKLVEGGMGVSFLYKSAVEEELASGRLISKKVRGFRLMREFNMISLKESIYTGQYDAYFHFFKELLEKETMDEQVTA